MKFPLHALLLAVLFSTSTQAQTAAEAVAQVKKLSEQGNHREAADLGKAALAKADATGELLEVTDDALSQLGAAQEQEEVIEAAVKAHSKKSDLLLAAGSAYLSLPHTGTLTDGKFVRGQTHDWNNRKTTELKDRVRALQLLEAAWKNLPTEADKSVRRAVLESMNEALCHDGE